MSRNDIDRNRDRDSDHDRKRDGDHDRNRDRRTRDDTTVDPDRTRAADSPSATEPADIAARAELLAAENRRLRAEYARAKRAGYRRTARGLAAVGVVAVLGGLLLPDSRQVLFVLGATGLFGGILVTTLTPDRFVAGSVSELIYAASAANWDAFVDELGLRDERLYLPGSGPQPPRLFVPQRATYTVPDDRSRRVSTRGDRRGFVLEPIGSRLFEEFERTLTDPVATEPTALAIQLTNGVVEQFELAGRAEPDVDPGNSRVTVAIGESTVGGLDRFDHPVASFLAVGFAEGLDRPIELAVDSGGDRADWLVTCRWDGDRDHDREADRDRDRDRN